MMKRQTPTGVASWRCGTLGHYWRSAPTVRPAGRSPPGAEVHNRPTSAFSETWAIRIIDSALYSLNIDVQRLRLKNNPSGSLTWLDARYALALAYFNTGRAKDAAQLIDSTAILHPDLGGNALHDKFVHLRQRLGLKP